MTEKKRTSRWINMLLIVLIPFGGYGCGGLAPVGEALFKLAVWVGDRLVTSAIAHTVEKALDEIFFPSAGEIVVDKTDPKKGIYKSPMKIKQENGNEAVLQDPPVVRNSASESSWTLDPKVKDEVLRKLE